MKQRIQELTQKRPEEQKLVLDGVRAFDPLPRRMTRTIEEARARGARAPPHAGHRADGPQRAACVSPPDLTIATDVPSTPRACSRPTRAPASQKVLADAKTLTELRVANDAIVALCFKVFGGEDVFEDVRIDSTPGAPGGPAAA